jgi:hypothetical protein
MKRAEDGIEILGLQPRRSTDRGEDDFTRERRIIVTNGRPNPLTQWAVGLVLAAVLFGWAGFFYFARLDIINTKADVKENNALSMANATAIRVIGIQLVGISEDVKEIKSDVKELKD